MATLFDPLEVGELELPNRIIMAPLTRTRAGVERIPNKLMAEYYAQRSSAGMILSEATSMAPTPLAVPSYEASPLKILHQPTKEGPNSRRAGTPGGPVRFKSRRHEAVRRKSPKIELGLCDSPDFHTVGAARC